ncbi:LysR family transcriptional regulator [Thalassospira povalilytica]|uniref:LysR family transcriptional regulator n=1 Tax=Thalassospira povalilytica TaxID=732237 RepID=A0A8I1MB49_9PROT|nr:LysR family transcriptional regulator [Thalassospira povalilytica]MBN8198617.1 LysR family transcriptional regulator [Thalassospira povalilytica]MCC4242734.1 LysR family transcriptional regulator [Thalassospira povalilytica]
MKRDELGDLMAFLAVAEERNFTRAAARLGTSQSALSHTVRRLEERLGLRLLTRTTRRVSPTEAGERLAKSLRPAFDDIADQISALSELRDKPAGTVRISTSEHAAKTIIWPAIRELLPDYPDLKVEINIDQKLTDIVGERYDAGVRLGEQVDKDMIAMRIGPDIRMAVVGAPSYFDRNGIPKSPHDLLEHDCINLRLPTLGGLYAWELEKDGHEVNVRVDGRLTFNNVPLILDAVMAGQGLACIPEDHILDYEKAGKMQRVLTDWCPPFPGYHLYYPNRRQPSPAFRLVMEALRYRAAA